MKVYRSRLAAFMVTLVSVGVLVRRMSQPSTTILPTVDFNESRKTVAWIHSSHSTALSQSSSNVGARNETRKRNDRDTEQQLHESPLVKEFEGRKSIICLTPACIEKTAQQLARAFPDRTNKDQWCFAPGKNNTNENTTTTTTDPTKGLILVKVPKAASSTMAGVVLRLAHRYHCDQNYIYWNHQHAYKKYAQRDRQQSIMILSVRDPAHQLISNIFWSFVTLRSYYSQQEISDEWLLDKAMNFKSNLGFLRHGQGGYTTQFAALENIPRDAAWSHQTRDVVHPEATVARIQAIMEGYDFILVVERMDESLVALSLLLGVSVGDVLVTSSKVSAATHDDDNHKQRRYVYSQRKHQCLPMVSSFVPPIVQQFFDSDLFRSLSYGDYLLHAAANMSLDRTIERLGVDRFQKALQEYRYWKQKEQEQCALQVQFPCSNTGQVQLTKAEENCYHRDMGCGYQCIDDMLARQKAT